MTDSLSPGGDGQTNHILALLRDGTSEGALGGHVDVQPGLALHADPAMDLEGTWHSPEGRLLELDARPAGRGAWLGLHLSLPVQDLRQCGAVGFAARIGAPEIQMARVCLRSGAGEGFEDCFFDKHLLFRAEDSSHVDMLPIHHRDRLPLQAPWRELVFFLPTTAFRLSLIDLRVFAV